jgi:hypothetical protein
MCSARGIAASSLRTVTSCGSSANVCATRSRKISPRRAFLTSALPTSLKNSVGTYSVRWSSSAAAACASPSGTSHLTPTLASMIKVAVFPNQHPARRLLHPWHFCLLTFRLHFANKRALFVHSQLRCVMDCFARERFCRYATHPRTRPQLFVALLINLSNGHLSHVEVIAFLPSYFKPPSSNAAAPAIPRSGPR